MNNFRVNRAFLDPLPLVQMSFMNGPIDKIVWQRRGGKAKGITSRAIQRKIMVKARLKQKN